MKKTISLILIVFVSILLISGCNSKLNDYVHISYEDFNAKKEVRDSFPLVIGSSTCSACAMYKVTMKKFIEEYQIEVFYIDVSELSEEDYNKLKSEINFSGTPTTVFYEDGKLTSYYNRLGGAEDITGVVNIFKNNGYVE